jgi:hypothetical protein
LHDAGLACAIRTNENRQWPDLNAFFIADRLKAGHGDPRDSLLAFWGAFHPASLFHLNFSFVAISMKIFRASIVANDP